MFQQAKHLTRHLPANMDATERNCETCMFCEKFCHNADNLKNHSLIHNGEKLFQIDLRLTTQLLSRELKLPVFKKKKKGS